MSNEKIKLSLSLFTSIPRVCASSSLLSGALRQSVSLESCKNIVIIFGVLATTPQDDEMTSKLFVRMMMGDAM